MLQVLVQCRNRTQVSPQAAIEEYKYYQRRAGRYGPGAEQVRVAGAVCPPEQLNPHRSLRLAVRRPHVRGGYGRALAVSRDISRLAGRRPDEARFTGRSGPLDRAAGGSRCELPQEFVRGFGISAAADCVRDDGGQPRRFKLPLTESVFLPGALRHQVRARKTRKDDGYEAEADGLRQDAVP